MSTDPKNGSFSKHAATSADDVGSAQSKIVISKAWVQGVALVMIFGFAVMGILALRTYSDGMAQPKQVVDESGTVVFTNANITEGQEIFLRRGLQEYGSVLGHGGYLGPDYTAEYLRMSADNITDTLRDEGTVDSSTATRDMLRANRYDEATGVLVWAPEQVAAYEHMVTYYADIFGESSTKYGLIPNMITDPQEIRDITAFFGWTAWASAAERPGHNYSYTNNWPAESRVDNAPTADVLLWSGMSLVALLAGLGALFALYGRWSKKIGWHASEVPSLQFL